MAIFGSFFTQYTHGKGKAPCHKIEIKSAWQNTGRIWAEGSIIAQNSKRDTMNLSFYIAIKCVWHVYKHIYTYIYIYTYLSMIFNTHTHTHIYIYICRAILSKEPQSGSLSIFFSVWKPCASNWKLFVLGMLIHKRHVYFETLTLSRTW